jgi:hypothetical protein
MTATRSCWVITLAAALLAGIPARAEDLVWRAAPADSSPAAAAPAPAEPEVVSAVLDRPVPDGEPAPPSSFKDRLFPTTHRAPPDPDPPPSVARGQPPDTVAPPVSGGPPPLPPPEGNQGVIIDRPLGHNFWDKCKGFFTEGGERGSATGRCCFQSDTCFPSLASPVTNPFLFEDPRALTEVRPLWFIQGLTGTLSMVPYLTVGQNFGRLPQGFGSFNAIATTGYSFSVNDARSEFFYLSTHLDYDVANLHRLWPLIELNWYHYTRAGNGPALGFEGTDLVNFGSSALGKRDFVTIGPGVRYKFGFCENLQTGLAVEFPLTSQRELTSYRITWDIIFRY